MYIWTVHQDLSADQELSSELSSQISLINIRSRIWHTICDKSEINLNLLLSCNRHLFSCSSVVGKTFYQMTPYKHYSVLVLYTPGKIQSTVVKNAMIWYKSREYQNLNQWKESKALLSTLTPDSLQQRFALPMNKTAVGLVSYSKYPGSKSLQ